MGSGGMVILRDRLPLYGDPYCTSHLRSPLINSVIQQLASYPVKKVPMSDEHKRIWFQAYCALLAQGPNTARDVANKALEAYAERFGDDASTSDAYDGWAHLEIMGHRSHYGMVREIRAYGTKLIEIQCLDDKCGLTDERHQYGGGAIFSNNPMDEETCRHGARSETLCRCRHRNDQGDLDCAKTVWSKFDCDAYCDEHQPKVDNESDTEIPW